MASVTRTTSGRWTATIRHRGWPSTSKTFRLKRDAKVWARQTEDRFERLALPLPIVFLMFPEAMARYLKTISPRKSANTYRGECGRARTLLRYFRRYSLAAITPDVVADYRDKRLADRRRHRRHIASPDNVPLAPATVRLELALLSHLFIIAIREWRIGLTVNPVALIQRPPPSICRTRRLGVDEERALLAEAKRYCNPMVARIIRIALETAMRQGEILNLRLDHVDLTRRVVRLHASKNGESRTVPLSRRATRAFKEAINDRNRPSASDYIFFGMAQSLEKAQAIYSFKTAWSDVRDRSGLQDFRFHDLRHEAISRLIEGGLGDQEVASISGHRSMQMLRRYTHLRAEDLVRKLDCMPRRKVSSLKR